MEQSNVSRLLQFEITTIEGKVCNSKPNNSTFDFIKVSAQIINNFSKVWQN